MSSEGERTLQATVEAARAVFGDRVRACYALGSLAHGGFSALVSDIDFGLLLSDPLLPSDADGVAKVQEKVLQVPGTMADRLSIFWGSPRSLKGELEGGRFPAYDRVDLIRNGRLIFGTEARDPALPVPSGRELVRSSAEFSFWMRDRFEITAKLLDPRLLIEEGNRGLTKVVLFPPRFLFTADKGEIATNHEAADHYLAHASGPAAELVRQGIRWRTEPIEPAHALATLRAGLLPLWHAFLERYEALMLEWNEVQLARQFEAWRRQLSEGRALT